MTGVWRSEETEGLPRGMTSRARSDERVATIARDPARRDAGGPRKDVRGALGEERG